MSNISLTGNIKNNFNLIRLLAAFQVLIVHTFGHFGVNNFVIQCLKIFPGVPIFFFISGYLIGGTYIKNSHKGLGVFFGNRVLRLFPGLIVCVLLSIITVYLTGYFSSKSFSFASFLVWIFGQISFFQFYNPEFMRDYGVGVLNGSLWTISVEIQFYLLTPFLYYFFKSKQLKPIIIFIFVFSLIANVYLRIYSDWSKLFFKLLTVSFLPWIFIFIIGFLFKYYERHIDFLKRVNPFLIFLPFVLSMLFIGDYKTNAMNSINPISATLLAILVYIFSQKELKIPNTFMNFVNESDISYGLYIYHMPIINTFLYLQFGNLYFNILISILLTILFSLLSWKFVEKPFLQKKS